MTFAVVGEEAFSRLCENGLRLLGGRCEIEVFEEARPDAMYGRCAGAVTSPLTAPGRLAVPCVWVNTDPASTLKCPVEGCLAGKG